MGKIIQRRCFKICHSFSENVAINDSCNEVVVVNESANSCETDLDTFQSRVCKHNAINSDIEGLNTGQAINTEAIRAPSDSLVHLNRQFHNQSNKTKTPKHLISCPFVRTRDNCFKGFHCDFLHRNTNPRKSTQNHQWQNPQPFFTNKCYVPSKLFHLPCEFQHFINPSQVHIPHV